jgi:CheY-like chemotaxis protein
MRVLIADRSSTSTDTIARLLSKAGCVTQVALDGSDALDLAMSWRPSACVFDLDVTVLDGFELARRIRRVPWGERCWLMAVAGCSRISQRHEAANAGYDCYIGRPLEPESLLQLVQMRAIERRLLL